MDLEEILKNILFSHVGCSGRIFFDLEKLELGSPCCCAESSEPMLLCGIYVELMQKRADDNSIKLAKSMKICTSAT